LKKLKKKKKKTMVPWLHK